MNSTIIQKGTILYRCAPTVELKKRRCYDTGKTGIYFSNYILQALAMSVEYTKDLQLGIYETTDDIVVAIGKYSVYNRNPIMCQEDLTEEEKTRNHFDNTILPIIDKEYSRYIVDNKIEFLEKDKGEIFIGKDEDIQKINLVSEYSVSYQKIHKCMRECSYSLEHPEYIKVIS